MYHPYMQAIMTTANPKSCNVFCASLERPTVASASPWTPPPLLGVMPPPMRDGRRRWATHPNAIIPALPVPALAHKTPALAVGLAGALRLVWQTELIVARMIERRKIAS